MESDENKAIVRMMLEKEFRNSMKSDIENALAEAGLNVSDNFKEKVKSLDFNQLENMKLSEIDSTLDDVNYARTW